EILKNLTNKSGFDSRSSCIRLLFRSEFFNNYADYIIDSIEVYEEGQREISHGGADQLLKQLICRFNTARSLSKILEYLGDNPNRIQLHHEDCFQFEYSEISKIITSAIPLAKSCTKVIVKVYRLYRKVEHIGFEAPWPEPFAQF